MSTTDVVKINIVRNKYRCRKKDLQGERFETIYEVWNIIFSAYGGI